MKKSMIEADQAVQDIRDGLDDAALMKKYGVSAKGLQSLFKKLVSAGVLEKSELEARAAETVTSIIVDIPTPKEKIASEVEPDEGLPRVLAVSENSALLDSIRDLLEIREITVIACADADLDLLRNIRPNLVLIDLNSGKNHHERFFTSLRQSEEFFPVVGLVDSMRQFALEGFEDAIYDLIEKPIDSGLFVGAVRRAVEYCDLVRFKRGHVRLMEETIRDRTREIAKARDILKAILDSSTLVSVVLTDVQQNVRFWNKGAESIFGYTADEMIGTKITRLYPPHRRTKSAVSKLRGVVETTDGGVNRKMEQVAKNGRKLTISLATSPVLDKEGNLEGILGIGLDVTEDTLQNSEILDMLNQAKRTQDVVILMLARLGEARAQGDGSRLTRIQKFCRILSVGASLRPAFQDTLTPKYIERIFRSCVLHDIGRIVLPDSALQGEEWTDQETLRQHPALGGRTLEEAAEKLGGNNFLSVGMEMAYYHHEHWDGSGYPFGLPGEEIPLAARILAIADAYDHMVFGSNEAERCSHEDAVKRIREGKGVQFDPELVEAFLEVASDFRKIL